MSGIFTRLARFIPFISKRVSQSHTLLNDIPRVGADPGHDSQKLMGRDLEGSCSLILSYSHSFISCECISDQSSQ